MKKNSSTGREKLDSLTRLETGEQNPKRWGNPLLLREKDRGEGPVEVPVKHWRSCSKWVRQVGL